MSIDRVCASCFGDEDLREWIRGQNGPRGCDACGQFDSPTTQLEPLCEFMQECLEKVWGFAVEQLPYESSEGGYQGATWTTYEILVEEVGLVLPRDRNNRLLHALIAGITDETWCEYDWLTLDTDVALRSSWEEFCDTVKHHRRFFFHSEGRDDRDSYTPASLLRAIAGIADQIGLVHVLEPDKRLWRARPDLGRGRRVSAADFGPPPLHLALQSNRMNPPGIPMLYLASTAQTALKETRATKARVGQWKINRPLRVLDLRKVPDVPGIFSGAERDHRLALRFLNRFARDIMMPVARDDRVHVEYLPSQVVTEYLRDYAFHGGQLDGVAYASTVHSGWNVALFCSRVELGIDAPEWGQPPVPPLIFVGAVRVGG